MKKFKKYLFLFTVLTLIVAVSGCGKKNTKAIDKNTIYREEELKINFPDGFEPDRISLSGDKLVFRGYSYDDINGYSKEYCGTVNVDGSDLKYFEMECPEDSYQYIDNIIPADNNELLISYTRYTEIYEEDNYSSSSENFIGRFSSDGKLIKQIELSTIVGEENWVQSMHFIDGKIVLYVGEKIVVLNSNMEVDKVVDNSSDYIDAIYEIKNGKHVVMKWDENGEGLYEYDLNTFKTGNKIEIPFSFYAYSIAEGGKSGYDFILRDNIKVYGYNVGDSEMKPLLNFIDSDIYVSYFNMFAPIESEVFISASTDWTADKPVTRICKYTKVAPEDVTDKTVLTLGALYIWDETKMDVINFNKTNPDYRITIIDYDSYRTEDDWDAGRKKFNSDISSGQGPDIILANDISVLSAYSNKKLFVDLNEYLDKDPDIDRADLFPNVLEACSNNGKLFAISPTFYVLTAAAKKSVLNGRTGWTVQEMIEFEKNLPEGTTLLADSTRYSVLSSILATSGESFINAREATCSFDSQEFVALLEYIKNLPEEYSYDDDDIIVYDKMMAPSEDSYRNNKIILYREYLSEIRSYNYIQKGVFGEDIELIGFPSADGNGSVMYFDNIYAISAKSGNPDAAWEFVRQYFTKEAMDKIEYGLPLSMSRFDALGEKAMQKPYYIDYNGEKVEYDEEYYFNGESIPLPQITKEELSELKAAILKVNKTQAAFEDIVPIIEEEAAYFFEGQKSAQDVANIIQSRVSIYLKEKQ